MSTNRVRREGPAWVFGRLDGSEPAWSALHDRRLEPGVVINDVPSLVKVGDQKVSLVLVRCECGTSVGMVWRIDRSARHLDALHVVAAHIVVNPSDTPRVTREALRLLKEDEVYRLDCSRHGSHQLEGRTLAAKARAVNPQGETMGRIILPRVSAAWS